MEDVGVEIQFEEGNIRIDGELIDGGWKPAWKILNEKLKKGVKNQRIEDYGTKDQQSKLYRGQEQGGLTDDGSCRICTQHSRKVEHLLAGCTKLPNSEYLTRHNRALMILAVAWANSRN